MILGHAANEETLVIDGIDKRIPRYELEKWGEDVAMITEETIADDFDKEYAGGKALKGYSDEHEQRKAREGYELTKGHMTGELQDQLNDGGFWRLTITKGRIAIKFDEEILYRRYNVAEWYAEQKVHGKRILRVLHKHAKEAQKYIRARVNEWLRANDREAA